VSARATLRQAKWIATELAHFGLDLVEHVVNTWLPSAQSPELRAAIAAAGAEESEIAKNVRPQPNPQM
jgi:hypothetical protein